MFCFNTGLTDIAAHFPRTRDEIVTEQLDLLQTFVEKILHFCRADAYGNGKAENGEEVHGKSDSPILENRGLLFFQLICFIYLSFFQWI